VSSLTLLWRFVVALATYLMWSPGIPPGAPPASRFPGRRSGPRPGPFYRCRKIPGTTPLWGLVAAYFRRTFGVLLAYHPARLAPAATRLSVHLERGSRAQSRESVPILPTSRHPRENLATAESCREQRAGHRYGGIGGEKAERRYAEREMSRTNVLTPG